MCARGCVCLLLLAAASVVKTEKPFSNLQLLTVHEGCCSAEDPVRPSVQELSREPIKALVLEMLRALLRVSGVPEPDFSEETVLPANSVKFLNPSPATRSVTFLPLRSNNAESEPDEENVTLKPATLPGTWWGPIGKRAPWQSGQRSVYLPRWLLSTPRVYSPAGEQHQYSGFIERMLKDFKGERRRW